MNTEIPTDTSEKIDKGQKKITPSLKNLIKYLTVEPYLICYILPSVISSVAVYKFNLEKACLVNLGYDEDVCTKLVAGVKENITSAVTESTVLLAQMNAWQRPLASSSALLILFFGAWSDRTGDRRTLMILPLLGDFVTSIGLIIATFFFFELPLMATALIEAIPTAVSGGISVSLMASFSYLADITTVEERTFRIGILGVIVSLGIPIGTALSGVLTEALGYYGIFTLNLVIYTIGLVYLFLRIKNVRKPEVFAKNRNFFIEFFNPKLVYDTLIILVKKRVGWKRLQVCLVVLAHAVIIGPVVGESGNVYSYVLKKYGFNLIDYSLFLTYSVLLGLAGTAIAVTIFSKLLKMHDSLLGIIATVSKISSCIVYALAPTWIWFYSGAAFDVFGSIGTPAIRSLATKTVEPNEVGKICSIIGLVETFAGIVYTPLFSLVHAAALEGPKEYLGAFYILGAIFTLPALVMFIVIYVLMKRVQKDKVKDPEAKEKYAIDNELTDFTSL